MSVNATISAAPSATQLTTLEYLWTRVYPEDPSSTSYTQQIIVTTLVTFVLHELAYFGAYLPFFIADCFPSLRKYKIQPNKPATSMMQWNCLKQLFFSHVVIQLPMMIFAYPGFEFLGMKHTLPLPHWTTVAWKMIVSLFIEDFYHYWGHRFLHHDSIYKYVHKLHHEYTAPFGITAEYAHPIETMFLGIGTMLPPLLLLNHVFEMEVWLVVRLLQTVAAHSGYDFPFSLHNWVPFWGGAEFHDFHHYNFKGNYSSTFRIWDIVFGTDNYYNEFIKRGGREKLKKLATTANNSDNKKGN
eukprot:GEZU01007872.1.p1 GENE.GEZU01007872.1~~GEZU01007872.1.p1  ORF type:complete len:316 (-),score=97.42 GEZU01007872.1:336-1232(-)